MNSSCDLPCLWFGFAMTTNATEAQKAERTSTRAKMATETLFSDVYGYCQCLLLLLLAIAYCLLRCLLPIVCCM